MYNIRISPEAKNDLSEIKRYIAEELSNPHAASRLTSQITKKIRRLSEYPGLGASLSSIVDIQTEYRYLVCHSYLIFYKYEEEFIFVSRILYGGRDYLRILFGDISVCEEE